MMVICDSLEKKKLIQRKSNPNDRRENLIVRTKQGIERSDKAMKLMEGYVSHFTGHLQQKEITAAMSVLMKLYDSLSGVEQ